MVYFWLILVVLLGIIEAVTVNLVSIWFVLSGIMALIVSLFVKSFAIQFGVFVIFGVIFMVVIKRYLEEKLVHHKEKTNLDRIIGMKGIVTEDIDDGHVGGVMVDGKRWSGVSDECFKKGEYVKILKMNGVKLEVKRWEE